jgi:hypothetical protein
MTYLTSMNIAQHIILYVMSLLRIFNLSVKMESSPQSVSIVREKRGRSTGLSGSTATLSGQPFRIRARLESLSHPSEELESGENMADITEIVAVESEHQVSAGTAAAGLRQAMLDKQRTEVLQSRQEQLEEALLHGQDCDPSIYQLYQSRLYKIDIASLDRPVLPHSLSQGLLCFTTALDRENPYTTLIARIRNWLTRNRLIGTPSSEGYAMKISIERPNINIDLFVLKVSRSSTGDIVHEAVVGLYALNKLRSRIPNFSYVYGTFSCDRPMIAGNEVITWCTGTNNSNRYLVMENIVGEELARLLSAGTITPTHLNLIMLQLFNALNMAYRRFDYTHYDLHSYNIIVRMLSSPGAIPYYGNRYDGDKPVEPSRYVVSNYVPVIIDYGFNHVRLEAPFNDIHLGRYGLRSSARQPDVSFPLFDVYKVICFAGYSAHNNAALMVELEYMFAFFGEGTLTARIEPRLKGVKDVFNADLRHRERSMADFISYLEPRLAHLIHQGNGSVPLVVEQEEESLIRLFFQETAEPQSFLELCDAWEAVEFSSFDTAAKELLFSQFRAINYEKLYQKGLAVIEQQLTEIGEQLKQPIPNIEPGSFVNNTTAEDYLNAVHRLARVKDLLFLATSQIKSAQCLLQKAELLEYEVVITNWLGRAKFLEQTYQGQRAKVSRIRDFTRRAEFQSTVQLPLDTSSANQISQQLNAANTDIVLL